jgi:hypothetical protein
VPEDDITHGAAAQRSDERDDGDAEDVHVSAGPLSSRRFFSAVLDI